MYLGNNSAYNYYTSSFRREQSEDWARDDEPQVRESTPVSKVVTARKARWAPRFGQQINPGDRVRVTTWFTYEVGGPRVGYFKEEIKLSPKPINA